MLTVLVLFSSGDIGGAERSLTRMVVNNNDDEIDYQMATIAGEGAWFAWTKELSLSVHLFHYRYIHLWQYLRKNNIDIVYICGFRLSVWLRIWRFFGFLSGIKLVQAVRWHPKSVSRLDKSFRFFERFFSFLLNAYICNAEISRHCLLSLGINKNKVVTIYNGLENLATIDKPREKQVITVANLSARKGHIAYLDVIAQVIIKHPDSQFIFIGQDYLSGRVQQVIKTRGLSDWVKYLGFQTDVVKYLAGARVFALPALFGEGCPTAILEAFACKLPVIAYDIDGISELVADGQDGFLIKRGQNNIMAERIIELLDDVALSEKMANAGFNKVKEKFTMIKMLEQHNDFFQQIQKNND